MAKAIAVIATGTPSEPKWRTPAPTRKVMPAPPKRANDVAKALARHSVGYCSGSQSVYTAKLAPPSPRKNRQTDKEPRQPARSEDGDHERADAAKFVAHRTPKKCQPPAHQEQGEEQAAVIPDVGLGGGHAGAGQKFPQRGNEDERIDRGVHAVKSPSAPRCPEAADLVSGKSSRCGSGRLASDRAGDVGHRRGNYTKKYPRPTAFRERNRQGVERSRSQFSQAVPSTGRGRRGGLRPFQQLFGIRPRWALAPRRGRRCSRSQPAQGVRSAPPG